MTHVLKFGGTSVGSAETLENAVRVIRERASRHRVIVVVSALAGVTASLDAAATTGDASIVEPLRDRHAALLHELTKADWNGSGATVARLLHFLRLQLRERALQGTPEHDAIVGIGERLAAPLVAEVLRHRDMRAAAIDATEIVRTDATHGGACIDLDVTRERLVQRLASLGDDVVPVITGYVGATGDGVPTTLGRGGSDITAAIVGAVIDADEVEIWSDVDGIYSADPRIALDARLLPRLTHGEALLHARNGAKVLHADAIPPLAQRGIRLSIRNTYAPERDGTVIDAQAPIALFIAGAQGKVGSALVKLIETLRPPNLRIASTARIASADDVDRDTLFVDCTASATVADLYQPLLERGIGVVTANKIAGSGDAARWRALRRRSQRLGTPLRYETTVGAALPVLRTARELAATGDALISIDAVLSGTISFILGRVHDGAAFAAAVAEAQARGFTEPDPRNDLSGRDVAAKLVILLRELGVSVELDHVHVDPVPPDLLPPPSGRRLVYVASYRDGIATARIRELDRDDPLARLRAGENMVIFRTRRYDAVPLTIAGPGAGPEVTAAGLLAEILEIGSRS